VLYQIKNFHSFLWASGGLFSDFNIHNIDECCWIKDAWPVKAEGNGGRNYRGEMVDQNFDSYDVEYTFADGSKLFFKGRCMEGCANQFASYGHGSKGAFQISANGPHAREAKIWRGQDMSTKPIWAWTAEGAQPVSARVGSPDGRRFARTSRTTKCGRGSEASLITSMGRMACHTGQVITRDDMLNCEHEFAPDVDKLTMTGPRPADREQRREVPRAAAGH
jgi:hypothetical protein